MVTILLIVESLILGSLAVVKIFKFIAQFRKRDDELVSTLYEDNMMMMPYDDDYDSHRLTIH